MVYITQLIYIREGQESIFDEFEDIAIPLIAKYNGQLLLRIRPAEDAFIGHHDNRPYEVHLAEFNSEADFQNYSNDEERKRYLHLKEQSIQSVFLVKGSKL